jgi:ribosomal protein S18 acetylase RimI-like enzyme
MDHRVPAPLGLYRIENPRAEEYRRLLPALLAHLPTAQREQKLRDLLGAVSDVGETSPSVANPEAAIHYLRGLFVARDLPSGQPQAVIWAHPAPGRTAVVGSVQRVAAGDGPWRVDDGLPPQAVQVALLQRVKQWAGELGAEWLQAVAPAADDPFAQSLKMAGMEKLVDLVFVASPDLDAADRQTIGPAEAELGPRDWEFHVAPPTDGNLERWCRLLRQSYEGSQDCPAIHGRRSLRQTVEGYRQTGARMDHGWIIAQSSRATRAAKASGPSADRGRGVGGGESFDLAGLILADHPADDFIELVYFGATPAARGRGIGRHLLAQASQIAQTMRRRCVIAAVDRENLPALRVYAAADYRAIEQKVVFAHFFQQNIQLFDSVDRVR